MDDLHRMKELAGLHEDDERPLWIDQQLPMEEILALKETLKQAHESAERIAGNLHHNQYAGFARTFYKISSMLEKAHYDLGPYK